MSPNIILLNGPPRCGKDTVGEILASLGSFWRRKFARPIVDYMFHEHGIRMESVNKDTPHPNLYGRTPREVAIAYSEQLCKPLFGTNYFGLQAVASIKALGPGFHSAFFVYTDSGFVEEAVEFLLANYRVLQVQMYRPGCDFEGDSRSHWRHNSIPSVAFHNNAPDLDSLRYAVKTQLLPEIYEWARG